MLLFSTLFLSIPQVSVKNLFSLEKFSAEKISFEPAVHAAGFDFPGLFCAAFRAHTKTGGFPFGKPPPFACLLNYSRPFSAMYSAVSMVTPVSMFSNSVVPLVRNSTAVWMP